ncbi:helix-turn-helix transcriptional regulator [Kitasatospora sp. NPDC059803]|uniref:helix-turn-helix transcriptional regulator n=1 Tax=Kitasatospora sp. NPDC059803 TaxID=3346953 RepID=UPI0036629352
MKDPVTVIHPFSLAARRKALDLSVAEVADRVGVHLATVYAWEAEDKTPTPAHYLMWCNALGLTYRDVVNHEAWEANPDAEFTFLSALLTLRRTTGTHFMSGEARLFRAPDGRRTPTAADLFNGLPTASAG